MTSRQWTPSSPKPSKDTFPRWVLFWVGGILALSLVSVGLVRLTGNGPDQLNAAVVQQRSLVFLDQADGGVRVVDGVSGATLKVLQGEQGFVRGALRALTRDRHARGLGPSDPFELIARTEGRLTLLDPSTGQHVDLESFGPTNKDQFARFLSMQPE